MSDKPYDLLLRGGQVVDAGRTESVPADVAFRQGRIAAIDHAIDPLLATTIKDCAGLFVAPGFVDLHTHVYWGGTSCGVDPEALAADSGATTLVDAGSAGPGNFQGFQSHVIDRVSVRLLAFLNVSFPGIYAMSTDVQVGESEDIRLVNPAACLRTARKHPDSIVGIKVRVGRYTSGAHGLAALRVALQVAEELALPVMAHIDHPPPDIREVLALLRPGDILTHCFRPFPNAPTVDRNTVRPEVVAAQERGVILDIGHGAASFSFTTADTMLGAQVLPDVISSDVHALSIDGPAINLCVTMSKFLNLGAPLAAVIERVTAAPARAIQRPELGTLAVGAVGDVTIFAVTDGEYTFVDGEGDVRSSGQAITCHARVVEGRMADDDKKLETS